MNDRDDDPSYECFSNDSIDYCKSYRLIPNIRFGVYINLEIRFGVLIVNILSIQK